MAIRFASKLLNIDTLWPLGRVKLERDPPWSYHGQTRPEVSEGGPDITNLIWGVAREEAERYKQIEDSMDLPLRPS